MNVTFHVFPTWLWSGVKVKTPVVESKLMFGCSPDAVMVIALVPVLGSEADMENVRELPTVAFCRL